MKKQLLLIIGIFLFGINSSFSYCTVPNARTESFYSDAGKTTGMIGTTLFFGGLVPTGIVATATGSTLTGLAVGGSLSGGILLAPLAVQGGVALQRTIRKARKKASYKLVKGTILDSKGKFQKEFEKFKKRNRKLEGIDKLKIEEFSLAINNLGENGELCNRHGYFLDKNKILKKVTGYIQTDEFKDSRALLHSQNYFYSNTSFKPEKFIDPRTSKCYQKDSESKDGLSEIKDLESECLGPQIIANTTKGGYYCGDVSYKKDKNGRRRLHIMAINTSVNIGNKTHEVCAGVIQNEEREIKSSCNHLGIDLHILFDQKNKEIDENTKKNETCLLLETRELSENQAVFNLCKDTEYKELKLDSYKGEMGALYDELKSDIALKNLMTSSEVDKDLLSVVRDRIEKKLAEKNSTMKLDDNLRIIWDVSDKEGYPLVTYSIFFDSSNKLQLDEDLKYESKCVDPVLYGTPEETCNSKHPIESKVDFDTFAMNNIGEGCIETRYEYLRRFTVSSNEQKEIASKNRKNANSNKANKR